MAMVKRGSIKNKCDKKEDISEISIFSNKIYVCKQCNSIELAKEEDTKDNKKCSKCSGNMGLFISSSAINDVVK